MGGFGIVILDSDRIQLPNKNESSIIKLSPGYGATGKVVAPFIAHNPRHDHCMSLFSVIRSIACLATSSVKDRLKGVSSLPKCADNVSTW